VKPFRFLADAFDATSIRELGERARAAEAIGVTTFILPDHLVPQLAPIPYLATVAALTERLRISAFVHNNDLRHPAVLAQELATLDVLSSGRLDVAIGAGWNEPEYRAIGLPFDPIGVRQARLAEAIAVLKGCFGELPSRSQASTTRSPTTTPTRSRSSSPIRRSSSVVADGRPSSWRVARRTSSDWHRGSCPASGRTSARSRGPRPRRRSTGFVRRRAIGSTPSSSTSTQRSGRSSSPMTSVARRGR